MADSKDGETKSISKTNATDTKFNINSTEVSAGKEGEPNCLTHSNKMLEYFCFSCKKSVCGVAQCHEMKHEVKPMKDAIDMFNKDASEVIKIADDTVNKLEEIIHDYINKKNSDFENELEVCRIAIEEHEQDLIQNIKKHTKALMLDLEKIHYNMKTDSGNQMENLESKKTQVHNSKTAITAMNNPEQIETLQHHMASINVVREQIKRDKFICTRILTPFFISSKDLDEMINTVGVGKIETVDSITYKVAEDDEVITVTKGEPFVLKVSSVTEKDTCQLAATLMKSSVQKLPTKIEYQEGGEYKITGRCNMEGDWLMKITAGAAHIKGSPVTIKVEKLGLVHTIENISDYKEHFKQSKVTDVISDRDGCMLVSSYSKDILKFNQFGLFARIQVPQDVKVNRMHQMSDGHIVYSDELGKRIIICDDEFKKISSVGKKLLKHPMGLTVKNGTRILYVADYEAHCVFKFNAENGNLLGRIDSESSEYIKQPNDVTLTKEGHVIIADFESSNIQMFDADDKFMRILIGCGEEDGQVSGPGGVTMDMDDNILVSSNHKLQLFDKNGILIKRIDHEDDGLDVPAGIAVISSRPRRVAVANHRKNNVKIFNY